MKWVTPVKIEEQKDLFNYQHSIMTVGSCFADEVGGRLKENGFDISVNPFGVIFNPVSILQLVQNALDGSVREDMMFNRDNKFFHYGYHSKVFGSDKEDLKGKIDSILYNAQNKLLQGDRLILTFGTAWAYRLNDQNRIVANCHKMPSALFTKELIDLNKLKAFSVELFTRLFAENPKMEVVVSVSPVRHSKDGLHENNISKSTLHLFCDFLVKKFDRIKYFPAYELVVDELRDYRFFKEDLVHPNDQAVEYVFEKFREAYFNDITKQRFILHDKLRKASLHHFINATLEEVKKHEDYITQLKTKIASLEN